jgi:hypothetical protein
MRHGRRSYSSPWYSDTSSHHRLRIAARYSSVRRPRRSNGTPRASNSSRSQPTPTPNSTRPPDSESTSVTALAVYTGLRWGTRQIPVPRRIRSVTAAR